VNERSEEANEKVSEGSCVLRLGDEGVLGRLLLLVDVLQVVETIGNVLFVTNIVLCDLMLASYALEDTVDKISESNRVVCPVFFEPISSNRVG
jgi:hypothetical protein